MKLTRSELYDALMLLVIDYSDIMKDEGEEGANDKTKSCPGCAMKNECQEVIDRELCVNVLIKEYVRAGKDLNKQKVNMLK
jgi:hypothetical protein